MHLTNVLVVPDVPAQLFSSRWGYEHDKVETYLNKDKCLRLPNASKIPFAKTERHYVINTYTLDEQSDGTLIMDLGDVTADTIHARLGHFNAVRINGALSKHGNSKIKHDSSTCKACMLNRKRKPHKIKEDKSPRIYSYFGERVCSDVVHARVRVGGLDLGDVEVFANASEVEGADGYAGMGLLRALDLWLEPGRLGVRRSGLPPRGSDVTAAGDCGRGDLACAS